MLIDYDVAILLALVFAAAGVSFHRVAKSCTDSEGRPMECEAPVPGQDVPISDLTNEDP